MDWGVPGGGGGIFVPEFQHGIDLINLGKSHLSRFQLIGSSYFGGLAKIMSLFFEYDSSYLGPKMKQQNNC